MIDTLVDTGSLSVNLISKDTANWLTSKGGVITKGKRVRVKSIHGSTIIDSELGLIFTFFNNHKKENESINIVAIIYDGLPYDLIIGRPTIEKHKLLGDTKISLSSDTFTFDCEVMGEDKTKNTHTPAPATKQSQWEEVANGFQDPSTLPTPILTDKQRRQAKQIF